MTQYRRPVAPGATWFFTVALAQRNGSQLVVDEVDKLRSAFRKVRATHPFQIDAVVILPEHLHCIWTLPAGDSDFSTRWSLIKGNFSRAIEKGEYRSETRRRRGERGLWQRRFWEHLIRDEDDFRHRADYIHWNPVKHGWVQKVSEWPHSSYSSFLRRGIYELNWGEIGVADIDAGE